MKTAIDVVSHKQIVCVWQASSDPEKLDQITKLTMDIPTNGQRTMHRLDVGLLRQNFFRLCETKGRAITLLQSTSTSGWDSSWHWEMPLIHSSSFCRESSIVRVINGNSLCRRRLNYGEGNG